jgi:hypothetical protein
VTREWRRVVDKCRDTRLTPPAAEYPDFCFICISAVKSYANEEDELNGAPGDIDINRVGVPLTALPLLT